MHHPDRRNAASRRHDRFAVGITVALTVLATQLLTCGGRPNVTPDPDGGGGGTLSGTVIKGRVGAATVTVYRFEDGVRAASVGTGTTAADGTFSVDVGISHGPFLVVVTRGAFTDEASGASIELNNEELTLIVPSFATATQMTGALVTPISHLATALALFYVRTEGLPLADAVEDAFFSLNAHFGGIDWRTVLPRDLTAEEGIQFDERTKAGLVLSGLSQMALTVSASAGLSAGGAVNPLSLTRTLYADLENDGYFDGTTPAGRLYLPAAGTVSSPYALDGATVRFTLATAIAAWLENARYRYGVRVTDVQTLLHAVSINSNPRIFKTPGNAFDQLPPEVAFVVAPPTFTGSSSIYVEVSAADVTGVSKVLLASDGVHFATTKQPNGNYGAVVAVDAGLNTITAWAEDTIGNTGAAAAAPYKLTAGTTVDLTAPVVQAVAGGSYASEQNIGIEIVDGTPTMPVKFTNIGAVEPVALGSSVYKSVARLDWAGVTPSAEELEATNASNTPWLKFRVPYNSQNDSPLAATYSISCAGCGDAATGVALAFPYFGDYQFYALPINGVTVPFLARATASALTLDIEVTVKDAAGHQDSVLGTLNVNLVGPTIGFKEDTGYSLATAPDPQSVYHYRVTPNTNSSRYDNLFSSSNTSFPNDAPARTIRVILKNPFPFPVVANLTATDTAEWTFGEDWDDDTFIPSAPETFSVDGFSYDRVYEWGDAAYRTYCRDSKPCLDDHDATHRAGNTSSKFTCIPTTQRPPNPTSALAVKNSGWSTRAYLSPKLGGDEQPDSAAVGGYELSSQPAWQIPAASSATSPGVAVIYVVIPRVRPGAPPLAYQTLEGRTARLQYHHGYFWAPDGVSDVCCVDGETNTTYCADNYRAIYWYRFLTSLGFTQTASWQLNARGMFSDGSTVTPFGGPRVSGTATSSVNVNLTSL